MSPGSVTSGGARTSSDWVVMFVDMVGSTELKYRVEAEKFVAVVCEVFEIIRKKTTNRAGIKFTGDGAMVVYRGASAACVEAAKAARSILQAAERLNLRFRLPRIQLRIGIAAGQCFDVGGVGGTDLTGTTADLAARLCAEADPDSILIDEVSRSMLSQEQSQVSEFFEFQPSHRRLSLKGVPLQPGGAESFHFLEPRLLLKPSRPDDSARGLLRLYPDRPSLRAVFRPAMFASLAAPGSEILVAGRTLVSWSNTGAEISQAVRERGVHFRFLIGSEAVADYLDDQQVLDIRRDLPEARERFLALAERHVDHVDVRDTDLLLLDGITCVRVLPKTWPRDGEPPDPGVLIVLQDINAAPGDAKAALLIGCNCEQTEAEPGSEHCMAHGLYHRTARLHERSRKLS